MSITLPIVTIVGRRNVGKSTLFNALIKQKKAIVDPLPGLTRDIIACTATHRESSFVIADTPGLDLPATAELSEAIRENARRHLERSTVIILLLENPGPEAFDLGLADEVRKLNIPTIVAVNKMDNAEELENMNNFYEMGFVDLVPISALGRFNIASLLDEIVEKLPSKKAALPASDLRLAIVGRPNAGKSTLLNAFLGYERSLVSEVPGTTRDAVDEDFIFHQKRVTVIDTAGIRKKSKIDNAVERYSLTRTIDAIGKSDVVIHMIDVTVGLTENDKKIADEILKARKPLIIALNKWDTLEKDHKTFDEYKDKLIFKFYRAEDFPIISISAKDKNRIHRVLETAFILAERARRRIETPKLNTVMADLQNARRIPQLGGRIKIYYAAQIDSVPPQFKFFVNNTEFFRKDTIRYFEKALKEAFDMEGVPVIIHLEGKKK